MVFSGRRAFAWGIVLQLIDHFGHELLKLPGRIAYSADVIDISVDLLLLQGFAAEFLGGDFSVGLETLKLGELSQLRNEIVSCAKRIHAAPQDINAGDRAVNARLIYKVVANFFQEGQGLFADQFDFASFVAA